MMRRHLLQWITVAGTMNQTLSASASKNRWIVDDGRMDLTPAYNVQREEGRATIRVFATFNSQKDNATVRLREGDDVSVNGVKLTGEEYEGAYVYRGLIDVSQVRLTFVVNRASRPEFRHEFSVPMLGVSQLPKQYKPYQTLKVPVTYEEPGAWVRERYDISIMKPPLRFDLISTLPDKENRYKIGRLPDIRDGSVVFRPINEFGLTPGVFPAELYRQHHIALRDMSPSTPRGWIYLTTTVAFSMEVL